jgi:hypothetical protein
MPPKTLPRVSLRDARFHSVHVPQSLYSLPTQQAKAKTLQYGVRVLHEYMNMSGFAFVGTEKDKCILTFLQNSWHNCLLHFIMPVSYFLHATLLTCEG